VRPVTLSAFGRALFAQRQRSSMSPGGTDLALPHWSKYLMAQPGWRPPARRSNHHHERFGVPRRAVARATTRKLGSGYL
jgi:hypothetical protein